MFFLPFYLSLCRLFFWFHNLFVPIHGSLSDPWKILFRISAASFYFPGQMWISKSGRHHRQKRFLHLWCMEIRFPETAVFLLLITDLLIWGYPFLFRILRGHVFFVFLHVFTSFYSYLNITVFFCAPFIWKLCSTDRVNTLPKNKKKASLERLSWNCNALRLICSCCYFVESF